MKVPFESYSLQQSTGLSASLRLLFGCASRPDCQTKAQRQQWHARPLAVLERVIAPHSLLALLTAIHSDTTRVLEFGTGEGRVLMELQLRFPEVSFIGLN